MKAQTVFALLSCALISLAGCQQSTGTAEKPSGIQPVTLTSRVVEASCGECKFEMEGTGCDLAIRVDGNSYYVDGAKMDDHGDAHSDDGMCNCIRQAKVSGEIKGGRFLATSFELLPQEKKPGADPAKQNSPTTGDASGTGTEKQHNHQE